mmetsp:Transcript_25610/g.54090  ORF Transcript_25610/g.54090 Transcript_25610/m.54090 type:complete len:405 (-) Transcript_25610:949-2163(-)
MLVIKISKAVVVVRGLDTFLDEMSALLVIVIRQSSQSFFRGCSMVLFISCNVTSFNVTSREMQTFVSPLRAARTHMLGECASKNRLASSIHGTTSQLNMGKNVCRRQPRFHAAPISHCREHRRKDLMKLHNIQPQQCIAPIGYQITFPDKEQRSKRHRPKRLPRLRRYLPLVRSIAQRTHGQAHGGSLDYHAGLMAGHFLRNDARKPRLHAQSHLQLWFVHNLAALAGRMLALVLRIFRRLVQRSQGLGKADDATARRIRRGFLIPNHRVPIPRGGRKFGRESIIAPRIIDEAGLIAEESAAFCRGVVHILVVTENGGEAGFDIFLLIRRVIGHRFRRRFFSSQRRIVVARTAFIGFGILQRRFRAFGLGATFIVLPSHLLLQSRHVDGMQVNVRFGNDGQQER